MDVMRSVLGMVVLLTIAFFTVSKQEEDQPAYRWRGVSVTGRDWRHYALVTASGVGSLKKSLLACIK